MQTVTIDRATWRRGKTKMNYDICGGTFLLNRKGMKCCLGFHAGQVCRVGDRALRGVMGPQHFDFDLAGLNQFSARSKTNHTVTVFALKAIRLNDDPTIPERLRERLLRAWAKIHGFRYVFTGKSPRRYWSR